MSDTLFALVIQIADDFLLLPNAAVAEVAGLEHYENAAPDAEEWIAGWHATAERRIPVLSFEALAGRPRAEAGKRGRIVIVNPIGQRMASGFALLAQDQPHLASIKADSLASIALRPGDDDDLVLARVKIEKREALIPDLEQIEARIASLA